MDRRISYSIIGIIVIVTGIYLLLPNFTTNPIQEYLKDGYMTTYTFDTYFSKLNVDMTSTPDSVKVKITVDGVSVYENTDTDITFTHNMGLGHHTIHIHIENPTLLGLGSSISVTGIIKIPIF